MYLYILASTIGQNIVTTSVKTIFNIGGGDDTLEQDIHPFQQTTGVDSTLKVEYALINGNEDSPNDSFLSIPYDATDVPLGMYTLQKMETGLYVNTTGRVLVRNSQSFTEYYKTIGFEGWFGTLLSMKPNMAYNILVYENPADFIFKKLTVSAPTGDVIIHLPSTTFPANYYLPNPLNCDVDISQFVSQNNMLAGVSLTTRVNGGGVLSTGVYNGVIKGNTGFDTFLQGKGYRVQINDTFVGNSVTFNNNMCVIQTQKRTLQSDTSRWRTSDVCLPNSSISADTPTSTYLFTIDEQNCKATSFITVLMQDDVLSCQIPSSDCVLMLTIPRYDTEKNGRMLSDSAIQVVYHLFSAVSAGSGFTEKSIIIIAACGAIGLFFFIFIAKNCDSSRIREVTNLLTSVYDRIFGKTTAQHPPNIHPQFAQHPPNIHPQFAQYPPNIPYLYQKQNAQSRGSMLQPAANERPP